MEVGSHLRGEGATLIDETGARIMQGVHPDMELAPRDIVARAIHRRVAAGGLMEAIEQEEAIDLGELWDGRGSFVLEVTGDSMIDAHIMDGDYVVVRQQSTADPGDIVVARTDEGEATLKYWFPEKNRIRLQPANKRLKPILVRDAQVIGVVVGVVRPM